MELVIHVVSDMEYKVNYKEGIELNEGKLFIALSILDGVLRSVQKGYNL